MTSVDYGDGQTQQYSFDSMGNRLSKTDAGGGLNGTENYAYNAANMLLSRAGNNYVNDQNGNTLSGGGRTNVWDSQNRLASCSFNGNTSLYIYSCNGLRHRSIVNSSATDFILDGSMFVREMQGGAVKATYFMGMCGPAYRRDDANGGSVRWYLYDGLGSVLGEVDPQGNITARRKYDVYGLARGGTGTPSSKHAFVGSLGHTSEDETGLVSMRVRYMDPQTGSFISQDPSRHGRNWFKYTSNNPINFRDYTGKEDFSIGSTIGSADIGATLDGIVSEAVAQDGVYFAAEEGGGNYLFDELTGKVVELSSRGGAKETFADWLTARGEDPSQWQYAAKEVARGGGKLFKVWLKWNVEATEIIGWLESDTAFVSHATPYVGAL